MTSKNSIYLYEKDFNPHEREARDWHVAEAPNGKFNILIHTSVKLVTSSWRPSHIRSCYFNPHEREARDA